MVICSVKTSEGLNLDKESWLGDWHVLVCHCAQLSLRQKTHTTAEFKHNTFINNSKLSVT